MKKDSFQEVPKEKWPTNTDNTTVLKVFFNKNFLVQIIDDRNGYNRITVSKTKSKMIRGIRVWMDGITWDELQSIKNAVGYENSWCVECFPPENKIINVANMRHLWILPEVPKYCWNWNKETCN